MLRQGWPKVAKKASGGREADDGKRLKAVDVVSALFLGENSLEWEGVPGGGGLKIGPGGKAGG